MNIYLNVGSSARELDSKLLLGVLAASGHQVLISSLNEITNGLKKISLPGHISY